LKLQFDRLLVAEQFTGKKGSYVKLEETLKSFEEIIDGRADDLPEQAFLQHRGSAGEGDGVVSAAEACAAILKGMLRDFDPFGVTSEFKTSGPSDGAQLSF